MGVLTWETYFVFNTDPNWWVIAHVTCATLFVYNLLRLVRVRDIGDGSPMVAWIKEHLTLTMVLCGLGAIGACVTVFFLDKDTILVLIGAGVVSVGYGYIPIKGFNALRTIPFAKVFLIGITYGFITAYVPIVNDIELPYPLWGPYSTDWFMATTFFIIAITIPFDIRDVEHDKKSGIKTIPLAIGIRGARIAAVVSALLATYGLYFFRTRYMTEGLHAIQATVVVFTVLLVAAIGKARVGGSELYYAYIVEGTVVLHALTVYLLFA